MMRQMKFIFCFFSISLHLGQFCTQGASSVAFQIFCKTKLNIAELQNHRGSGLRSLVCQITFLPGFLNDAVCYSLKEIYTFNLFSFNLSFSNRPAFTIKSLLTDPDIYSQHLKAINTILWLHHLYLVIEPVPKMIFILKLPFNQHHHPRHRMSIAKFVTASNISRGCTNMVSLRLN